MINDDQSVPPSFSAKVADTCPVCHGTHLIEVEVPVRHLEPCRACRPRTPKTVA